MLVAIPPGCTFTADTPVSRSSWRSESVNPRMANFEAQYALWYGIPTRPNTLDVFTITPESCSSSTGRKARVPLTTPSKLIRRSHSSSAGSPPATVAATVTPALLNTEPSGVGSQLLTSAANASSAPASLTSSTRVSTGPGSESAVSLSPDSSRSAIATGEPSWDSRRARLRPMPEAAPVIIADRPAIVLRLPGIAAPCRPRSLPTRSRCR
jgi:hypothetical protein